MCPRQSQLVLHSNFVYPPPSLQDIRVRTLWVRFVYTTLALVSSSTPLGPAPVSRRTSTQTPSALGLCKHHVPSWPVFLATHSHPKPQVPRAPARNAVSR